MITKRPLGMQHYLSRAWIQISCLHTNLMHPVKMKGTVRVLTDSQSTSHYSFPDFPEQGAHWFPLPWLFSAVNQYKLHIPTYARVVLPIVQANRPMCCIDLHNISPCSLCSTVQLLNEEPTDMQSSANINRVNKSRRMRRLGHVALWGEETCIQGFGEESWGKETTWKTQA